MKFYITILLFFYSLISFSQTKLDTLLHNLKTAHHDTTVYNAYMALGNYFQYSNPDTAIYFHTQAEKVAEKIPGAEGELRKCNGIKQKGVDYYVLSDYKQALTFFENAMNIVEKYLNNKECGLKAKKLWAASVGNIGVIYDEQGNYAKALEYYFKALKMDEELGNKNGIASDLGNIGVIYDEQGNYAKALEYYFKALKICEEIGDKSNQATILGNIGIVYSDQGNYAKALEYYLKTFQINEEIGNKQGQAINFGSIGSAYLKLKQFSKAEEYLKKAEQLNRTLGTIYYLKDDCASLSELYEQTGKYKDALYYYKEFTHAKDSLNSQENRKALQTMELKYQYEKEQAVKEKEHQKQLEIQRKEKERQQTISYAVGSGLFLVIIFSMFIFNRLQVTRKQKQVIETQKQQVESQKHLVEEKNKEITDSITYAKRIQNAILPSEEQWKKHLPNSFVYYLPKDIVAGDFYWLETGGEALETTVYFAAADCTGHGVPGAMVSVVCSNALTKAVIEEKITEPGKILDRTRELVIERFAKSSEEVKDGMDISLCAIDFNKMTLQWAGANNPLWIVRKNEHQVAELVEAKPDKQPIGKVENPQPFTTHTIELQKGDTIYIFTDGFADQFGGEKGKKFKYKSFKELLLSIQDKSMDEQKQIIEQTFINWKGELEQVDDVCVIGVRM